MSSLGAHLLCHEAAHLSVFFGMLVETHLIFLGLVYISNSDLQYFLSVEMCFSYLIFHFTVQL